MLRTRTTAALFSSLLLLLSVALVQAQTRPFRVGSVAPVDLNPATGSNDPEVMFNRMIYDYLLDVAPSGDIVPALATSYDISSDGLTYTLSLVQNAVFHDGTPLTAADVVYSFGYLKEVGSPALNLLGTFEVAAADDYTVVFLLTQPNADFLFGLASNWSFILKNGTSAPNVLTEGATPYANFNGTGAFILRDYKPNVSATFTRNPNYWGTPAALETVEMIFIQDQQAQIDALKSGTVDFIYKIAYDRLAELEAASGVVTLVKATNQHPVIRIRSDEGHLGADVRVRQAFKYATDREILNLNLFNGVATVGNNDPIGPLYGEFFDPTVENQPYDPARACALLAEAGYPDGIGAGDPLPFYIDDSFNYVQMAEFLQQQWAEACINVALLPRNPGDYYAGDANTAEWLNVELGVTGWGSRPTPQQYLVEAYVTGASYNESRWSDPELDALVAEAGMTADPVTRAALYGQIARIFAERGSIIVPFFAPIIGATREGVGSLDMHPFPGRTNLASVTLDS